MADSNSVTAALATLGANGWTVANSTSGPYAGTSNLANGTAAQVIALVSGAWIRQIVPDATGMASTDTFNIQNRLNGLGPRGGRIFLQGGAEYVTNGGIGVQYPTTICGDGSSDGYSGVFGGGDYANESETAASTIVSISPTRNLFQVNANGCSFENLHMSNRALSGSTPVEPTGGAAIRFGTHTSAGDGAITQANGFKIVGCSTNRFFVNIDVVNAVAWHMAWNKIIGHMKYGVRVNNFSNSDEGDPMVVGNHIMSGRNSYGPDAGIFWQSGGGMKAIGNKISRKGADAESMAWRHKKGIWYQPPTGSVSGVMNVTSGSIEAIDEDCILIDQSLGGYCSDVIISAMEFNMSVLNKNGVTQNGNVIRGLQGGGAVGKCTVDGIHINGCYNAIRSEYFTALNIGRMIIESLRNAAISLANGQEVGYDLNLITLRNPSANAILLADSTGTNYLSPAGRQGTNKRRVREMPAMASIGVGGAVNLYRIDIGSGASINGAGITLVFSGAVSGVGAYRHQIRRFIAGNGAGAATIATIGTDEVSGTQLLTFTVTQSAGFVTFAVYANTGVGVNQTQYSGVATGEVVISIEGTVREFVLS